MAMVITKRRLLGGQRAAQSRPKVGGMAGALLGKESLPNVGLQVHRSDQHPEKAHLGSNPELAPYVHLPKLLPDAEEGFQENGCWGRQRS